MSDTKSVPDGWHYTEKYGDVFTSNNISWVVQRFGNQLESVTVNISPDQIAKTPATERMRRIVLGKCKGKHQQ